MVVVDVEMCVVCKLMGVIMTEVEGFVIIKGEAAGLALLFFFWGRLSENYFIPL